MNALVLAPIAVFALVLAPRQDASAADWRLDVAVDPPRPVTVRPNGKPARVVWYSTFTITNSTGAARTPVIVAKLVTDTGKSCTSGYDPAAIAAIQAAAGEATSLYDWNEPLEAGASKKVFAIFGDVDRNANYLDVRLSGVASALSRHRGEWFEQEVEYRAKFHRPGSDRNAENNPVSPAGSEWVVLSKKKIRG